MTCGNSGPKPGVVFVHACSGALSQYGKLAHINVGNWPDDGQKPEMTSATAAALVDWCYAAVAAQGLKGRRAVVFGHDSMGMETALAHVIPTRQFYGLELTRLDMKLFADMIARKACDAEELAALRDWIKRMAGARLAIGQAGDEARLDVSLAMYLVMRDLLKDLNAVAGGFMNQLEWGSDPRGIPLPIPDIMESLLNSSFDHNGPKTPVPYATEADTQAMLTMLFFSWLAGGAAPLFMDFRKVWEPFEVRALAEKIGVALDPEALWVRKGFVDGDNSGSASLDWAGTPGQSIFLPPSRITSPAWAIPSRSSLPAAWKASPAVWPTVPRAACSRWFGTRPAPSNCPRKWRRRWPTPPIRPGRIPLSRRNTP
ncbi:MAG: L-fucose isomerase [candidate division BRC1 bacterium ADurb.BinA364]|nr:MAG: L-fucose isomerase [candidate division BRC1 bacterium ADurb.BinA364]